MFILLESEVRSCFAVGGGGSVLHMCTFVQFAVCT